MNTAINLLVLMTFLATLSSVRAADAPKNAQENELAGKVLKKFDANGDGQVDQREQAAARMQNGGRGFGPGGPGKDGKKGGPTLQELAKKFDANGNGKLEPDEIKAAKAEWEKRGTAKGNKGNANPGAPGKGAGAGAEQRRAMYFQTLIAQFDANGNGELDAKEIQAAQAAMQAAQAQRQAAQAQRQGPKGQAAKRRPGLRGKK